MRGVAIWLSMRTLVFSLLSARTRPQEELAQTPHVIQNSILPRPLGLAVHEDPPFLLLLRRLGSYEGIHNP